MGNKGEWQGGRSAEGGGRVVSRVWAVKEGVSGGHCPASSLQVEPEDAAVPELPAVVPRGLHPVSEQAPSCTGTEPGQTLPGALPIPDQVVFLSSEALPTG